MGQARDTDSSNGKLKASNAAGKRSSMRLMKNRELLGLVRQPCWTYSRVE